MVSVRRRFISLAVVFFVAACNSASPTSSPTRVNTATAATATTAATGEAAKNTALPAPSGMPPQSTAATITPPDRRPELTRLSNLLHFKLTGWNGADLGAISDYVINTCETYIVYMLVDPANDLKVPVGQQLLIPFESVTINSGILDAQAKAIALALGPDPLKSAPTVTARRPLFPIDWEQPARDYWGKLVRVGKLSSECRAGGGAAIHKIAYATQLIGAQLYDGNHALLGAVQDAILEPESGKLGFYMIHLQASPDLILIPLAKTNIPDSALQPGSKTELVLLADGARLAGAPRLANPVQASEAAAQSAARGYWGN
jgi:sporulation protein YlmC with PRC-barrel domain